MGSGGPPLRPDELQHVRRRPTAACFGCRCGRRRISTRRPRIRTRRPAIGLVKLEDLALAPGDVVDLWVQRDDTLYGFPLRGRQSHFDVKSYHRFDHEGRDNQKDDPACPVRLEGTINAIATGPSPVVMGGFMRREQAPAKYSSGGPISPTRGFRRRTATASPPWPRPTIRSSSRACSARALEAAPWSRWTERASLAPRTARFLAENLAAGGNGDRAAVQALPVLPASAGFPSWREGWGMIAFRPVVRARRS